MKNFSRVSFFAVLLLCATTAEANNFLLDTVEETVEKVSWYSEQAFRAYCLTRVGHAIQENVPMTKVIEDLFTFVDELPLAKEHDLRHKVATIAWGAVAFTLLKKIADQKDIHRATKEASSLHWLLHRALEFKTYKDA